MFVVHNARDVCCNVLVLYFVHEGALLFLCCIMFGKTQKTQKDSETGYSCSKSERKTCIAVTEV